MNRFKIAQNIAVIGLVIFWGSTLATGIMHIAKLNGRVCGAKRPHSVFEQSICYLPV